MMMEKKEVKGETPTDRRIQKTKKQLSEAMIALILEKGYDSITIQDITDRANVGRSTFYTHYESKEQLFIKGHQNLGVFLFEQTPGVKTEQLGLDLHFLKLFQHVSKNHLLAKALLGKKGGEVLTGYFRDIVASKLIAHYKKGVKDTSELSMLTYTSEAAAFGIIRLLTCWVDENMIFTPEIMAEKSESFLKSLFHE